MGDVPPGRGSADGRWKFFYRECGSHSYCKTRWNPPKTPIFVKNPASPGRYLPDGTGCGEARSLAVCKTWHARNSSYSTRNTASKWPAATFIAVESAKMRAWNGLGGRTFAAGDASSCEIWTRLSRFTRRRSGLRKSSARPGSLIRFRPCPDLLWIWPLFYGAGTWRTLVACDPGPGSGTGFGISEFLNRGTIWSAMAMA